MPRLSVRKGGALAAGAMAAALTGGMLANSQVTDAAWQDTLYGRGEFALSAVNMQAKVATDSWSEYFTLADAGTLEWSPQLAPGESTYASVDLRLAPGSPLSVTVGLAAPAQQSGSTALWNELTYHVYIAQTPSTPCDGHNGLLAKIAPPESPLSYVPDTTWPLGAPTTTNPGPVTRICIGLTLPEDPPASLNGESVTAVWTFTSESD